MVRDELDWLAHRPVLQLRRERSQAQAGVEVIIGAYVERAAPEHPAGAEWSLHDTMLWLARQGHDCRVVNQYGYMQERLGVVDGESGGVLVYGHPDDELLARHFTECDVMLTQMEATAHAQVLAATYQTPLVHFVHGAGGATRIAPSCAALVVFNTEQLSNFGAWISHRSIVLHPVVDEDRVKVGGPGRATTLVGMSHNKGAIHFYQLAQELENLPFMGVMGGYDEQVIGPEGIPGSRFDPMPTSLPANMRVMAPTRDIREYYAYTRQLVMLSINETYGRVAAEAIVSGIPVIAARTPGLEECLGADWPYFVENRDDQHLLIKLIKDGYTGAWDARSMVALDRAEANQTRQDDELCALLDELENIAANPAEMRLA